MSRLSNGSRVDMIWNRGEEAICPACHHRNAMLYTGKIDSHSIYECRDCHLIVVVTLEDAQRRRNDIREVEGTVIARSLGKSCSRCGSFEMKEEKRGSWMFKCQECDAPAVKY